MASQGTFDLSVVRGDTLGGYPFTFTQNGSPVAVTSARAQMRASDGSLIHTFNCTVSGAGSNVVTLAAVDAATTAGFPLGRHVWDLELTLSTGLVRTWVRGAVVVTGDVTQ